MDDSPTTDDPSHELVAALRALYGLDATTASITALPGEIDRNVKVELDGGSFVLRIHAADVDPAEADLQASVMTFLHDVAPELARAAGGAQPRRARCCPPTRSTTDRHVCCG